MSRYRSNLPQLAGGLFLSDGGIETDLIFNHGIEIPEFAAHTLLPRADGRAAMADYFRDFLSLARQHNAGFILDSQTWKAHPHWAQELGATPKELRDSNVESIRFIAGLRDEFPDNPPVVLCGVIGPRGDAYAPEARVAAREAQDYHRQQVEWLAETEVDMICGTTYTWAWRGALNRPACRSSFRSPSRLTAAYPRVKPWAMRYARWTMPPPAHLPTSASIAPTRITSSAYLKNPTGPTVSGRYGVTPRDKVTRNWTRARYWMTVTRRNWRVSMER